jgi:hypothetical protein
LPTAVLGFNFLTRHKFPYLLRLHLPIYWRCYCSGIWKCFCSSEIMVLFGFNFFNSFYGPSRSKEERLMRRPSPYTCLSVYKVGVNFFLIQRKSYLRNFSKKSGFHKRRLIETYAVLRGVNAFLPLLSLLIGRSG